MDSWDLVLLVVAGYVGTVTLVRLMIRRRDYLLEKLRRQMANQRQGKPAPKASEQQPRPRRAEAA